MPEEIRKAFTEWMSTLSPLYRMRLTTIAVILVEVAFEAGWKACESQKARKETV